MFVVTVEFTGKKSLNSNKTLMDVLHAPDVNRRQTYAVTSVAWRGTNGVRIAGRVISPIVMEISISALSSPPLPFRHSFFAPFVPLFAPPAPFLARGSGLGLPAKRLRFYVNQLDRKSRDRT